MVAGSGAFCESDAASCAQTQADQMDLYRRPQCHDFFDFFFLMAIIKIKELRKKMSSLCKCVNGCAFW